MTDTATCYHEAAHAVVGYMLGAEVTGLSLGGEEDDDLPERMGECRMAWPGQDSEPLTVARRQILTLLAGAVAEQIYDGDCDELGDFLLASLHDVQRAERLALDMTRHPQKAKRVLMSSVAWLREVLVQPHCWAAVSALADELDAHEWLDREEIEPVLEFWLGG